VIAGAERQQFTDLRRAPETFERTHLSEGA
jgi:hypothetical protein